MNYIEKIQAELGGWYEESSIASFMAWWKFHLKSFVPESYHNKLFADSCSIFLVPKGAEMEVWYKQSELDSIKKLNQEEDTEESWWHQTQHLISETDGKPYSIDYLVPQDKVLVRKIALPAAAKENLDEVIGFELDKYVPFSLEQVQLSYKVDVKNSNDEKILMDLAVMPKELLASIIKQCDEKAIALSSIDVNKSEQGAPHRLGVNLLPREKRKARDYTNLKLNSVLFILLLGLIYFVMTSSLSSKQERIDQLTDVNTELQKQARTSKLLKKELKEAIVSSQFLNTKQLAYKSPVDLLFELTNILPDHTYVTRLRITEESLEVSGESDNANGLIPKMDKSDKWYSPNFPRAIVPNARTGKEKFTIEAGLIKPEEDENDSTS